MLVIMEAGISSSDDRCRAVATKAKSLGLEPEVGSIQGKEHTLTQVFLKNGKKVNCASLSEYLFQRMSGVDTVQRVTPPSVSLAHHKDNGEYHQIQIGNDMVATGRPCLLVAGPCTVDKMIDPIVHKLAFYGIKRIRGGCWKPRSTPESFPGFGKDAVLWLLQAAKKYKMEAVFLEVIESEHIEIVKWARGETGYAGTIVLWVGARTSNPILLRKLGEQNQFPVMVKNGLDDKGIDDLAKRMEWVLARQSVWNGDGTLNVAQSLQPGNNRVIPCLRGVRQTERHSRYRFAPNHSWTEVIQREWWAPVAIDPSHSAGEEKLVMENIIEALRFKPSLMIVEGGYDGDYRGLCDMAQALTAENIREVSRLIAKHNKKVYGVRTF